LIFATVFSFEQQEFILVSIIVLKWVNKVFSCQKVAVKDAGWN